MTRTLVVMRHAKAEPYADEDRARRLTERGRADATAAGRHLAERGLVPEHALVSSATRAQESWAAVREGSGATVEADVSDAVYAASAGSILEWLRLLPEDRHTAIFIGHNPSAGSLVHLLDDQEGDPAVLGQMVHGFPTAALAVFEVPGGWEGLAERGARLTHFHVGRG